MLEHRCFKKGDCGGGVLLARPRVVTFAARRPRWRRKRCSHSLPCAALATDDGGSQLRVVSEKGQFRTLPAGETKPAPRGDVPCAIAAHATKSDGSAGRAGEVAVVIHQVALGMRFSSDLKLGDLVPLEPGVPGTTYSFEVQPGFLNVVLAKMPLRADEQDELYEQLKKPRDEELYEQVKNVKDEV